MMKSITARDIWILAWTIYGEARGEDGMTAKEACGWSVRNRAERHNWSIAEAALKSVHYSTWNNAAANDANQLAMLTADVDELAFALCFKAAINVAHGLTHDPTGGATHYHADYIKPPKWAYDQRTGERLPYQKFGHHLFYTGVR